MTRHHAPPMESFIKAGVLHMYGRRTTAIAELGSTISLCGLEFPDSEVEVHGLGKRPRADLREFAPDTEATCRDCRKARERRRPSWLRRLWRKIRGTEEPTTITIGM